MSDTETIEFSSAYVNEIGVYQAELVQAGIGISVLRSGKVCVDVKGRNCRLMFDVEPDAARHLAGLLIAAAEEA